jgi:hypothetical protein
MLCTRAAERTRLVEKVASWLREYFEQTVGAKA